LRRNVCRKTEKQIIFIPGFHILFRDGASSHIGGDQAEGGEAGRKDSGVEESSMSFVLHIIRRFFCLFREGAHYFGISSGEADCEGAEEEDLGNGDRAKECT